ncbi:MAG: ABC transporter substrate-binding protein [Candidatus Dormibacteraeota bacterium]|uniref:ABC transporter substrate-binding protein n=1 Tax=Candidatus Dormiibacter inghamiae TaxID=3127013 RepID=A0A934KFB1_9BACT|nr:ABC transporter substrate-binding protein [Candidatus Dormibacteraeota bacterium]MBJ7604949.1 ABC transporter substrate-binding protein [Candidatus Dormibacteraeota bacterium]
MRSGIRALVVGAIFFLLAACGGSSGGGQADSGSSYKGKELKLGAILSLTGAGAVYGPSSKNGADLAVEQINKSGGVNGATITLDTQDDASDKAQAAQAAQKLIQQGQVVGLLGPTLSNSAVAVHPLAENLKTPIVAVSTTGIHIVPDCNYPKTDPCKYVFRDSLGEEAAIPANIKALADKTHPKTGALLVAKDDKFSADGGEIVKKAAPANGVQLLGSIEFSKADADLSLPVTKAVQLKPDVIFITSLGGIPAKIMIEARKQGFTGQFLGGNGFNTAVVSKQAGDAGRGAQSASAWFTDNDFKSNKEFVTAYKTKYAQNPDQFAAQGYTGVLIMADAAKRAKLSFSNVSQDRDNLRNALETVKIDSPLGPFQFTKNHDVKQTIWIIQMDGTGGFKLVQKIAS